MVTVKSLFLIKKTRKIMKLCRNCRPRKPERFFLPIRTRQSVYDEDIENYQSKNFQYCRDTPNRDTPKKKDLPGKVGGLRGPTEDIASLSDSEEDASSPRSKKPEGPER